MKQPLKIKMILAMAENGAIGKDGQLPWGRQFPQDLDYFKHQTLGKITIWGRKTFEGLELPKGLSDRHTVIVTSKPDGYEDGIIALTIEELEKQLALLASDEETGILDELIPDIVEDPEVWIVGGKTLYEKYLPLIDELHITRIPGEFDADTTLDIDFGLDIAWTEERTVILQDDLVVDVYCK